MKNHKQGFSSNTNDNIDPTFHMMNEIANKEIFSQMKPSMIENHNKILFRQQDQAFNVAHTPGNEKYQEELCQDFRKEIEKNFEENEKKKVLLQQRFNLATKQKAKEIHQLKQLPSTSMPQKKSFNQLFESQTPQATPRLKVQEKRLSVFSSKESLQKNLQKDTLNDEQNQKKFENVENFDLQRLKQHKNQDGSLDAFELMAKVKYNKIKLEEVSVADIMGNAFDVYNNAEANRVLTIKSELSKEKQELLEKLKDDQQKKKFAEIQQKIQKGEVQNLDLGYLSQFQKQQHFKLVQLGKKRADSQGPVVKENNFFNSSALLKDKILQQKIKDQDQDTEKTQNLITNVSYFTPSNSQYLPGVHDNSKCDQFSDYFSNFERSSQSAKSLTQTPRTGRQSFVQNINDDINLMRAKNNSCQIFQQTSQEEIPNSPSQKIQTIGDTIHFNRKYSNFTENQARRSFFSRGATQQSVLKNNTDQSSISKIADSFDTQTLKTETTYINDQKQETPKAGRKQSSNTFSPLLFKTLNQISTNFKVFDSAQNFSNSPLQTMSKPNNDSQMSLQKRYSLQSVSGAQNQLSSKQLPVKVQSLNNQIYSPSHFNQDASQKQIVNGQTPSTQPDQFITPKGQFKFNHFLASKQKQRNSLHLSRGNKARNSLICQNGISNSPQQSDQKQNASADFVFNQFLR